jgi:lysophospholipase L1-like esterase
MRTATVGAFLLVAAAACSAGRATPGSPRQSSTSDTTAATTSPSTATGLATGPGVVYYLALGDSVGMWNGDKSYPFLITSNEQSTLAGLRLVDMACSGESTTTMLANSTCAPGGSQYANAVSFLEAHRGAVALITLDIGGNDVVNCMNAANAATCFSDGVATMQKNLATILAGLRAAAPGVPIVGMNIYNPLLGDWLAPGPPRALALAAATALMTLSADMEKAFAAAGAPVADVQGAFQSSELTTLVPSPWGQVPVAVDRACSLLDIVCQPGQAEGFGDDPNDAGAAVIAKAFETVIGTLRPPGR